MNYIYFLSDIFLNLDKHLALLASDYGTFIYFILFFVIFIETGIVVFPFLPGDSLLFAAGAISAIGTMNPIFLFVFLSFSAIIGNTVNYSAGKYFRKKIRENGETLGFIKKEHLDKTNEFYKKYGNKTIFITRFFPIVRTIAPFVAGLADMERSKFMFWNSIGGISWTALFIFGGYFFGNIPMVKENLSLAMMGIIFLSVLPGIIGVNKSFKE